VEYFGPGSRAHRPIAVAAASGAASVRVWHITSRGWDPWTERPLPEVVRVAYPLDTALCWGPGLRWGIMGNMMLNHLAGGPGGIEHFFQQFTGPMTAWWKTLGSPVLTPEVQKKLIDSVHAEVGSCTIEELEEERDDILLGLLELRNRRAEMAARGAAIAE
jgi:hypothetical protein